MEVESKFRIASLIFFNLFDFKFQVVAEINYVEWRDKDKNLVFDDPGPGNYTCAFMAGKVPAEDPPEPTKPVEKKVVEEKKQKITRKEKREIAMKKNK